MKLKKEQKPWTLVRDTPFFGAWRNMKTRCNNTNTIDYKNYGGRGITVCKEWLSFAGFYKDMYSIYKKGLTLDRIDNNGNYCKNNCRWATRKKQAQNRRNAFIIEYKGIIDNLHNWANYLGFNSGTLHWRIVKLNWSVEKAFFTSVKGGI